MRSSSLYWFSENRKFAFGAFACFRDYEPHCLGSGVGGLAFRGGLACLLSFGFPPLAGFFQLAVTGVENLLLPAFELILGREVAEGAVQADGIVVLDEACHDAAGVLQGQGRPGADTIFLENPVPAFNLAVALGVVGRGLHMGHAAQADELLEIPGDELRSIV